MLSLSVTACKSVSSRLLSLWSLMSGQCIRELTIAGAIGGFPLLKYPFAFLPSASRGLEIWDLREKQETRVRCIGTNVFSYLIKNQFLFVLNKHSQMKIYRVGEVTRGETNSDILWTRKGRVRKLKSKSLFIVVLKFPSICTFTTILFQS